MAVNHEHGWSLFGPCYDLTSDVTPLLTLLVLFFLTCFLYSILNYFSLPCFALKTNNNGKKIIK